MIFFIQNGVGSPCPTDDALQLHSFSVHKCLYPFHEFTTWLLTLEFTPYIWETCDFVLPFTRCHALFMYLSALAEGYGASVNVPLQFSQHRIYPCVYKFLYCHIRSLHMALLTRLEVKQWHHDSLPLTGAEHYPRDCLIQLYVLQMFNSRLFIVSQEESENWYRWKDNFNFLLCPHDYSGWDKMTFATYLFFSMLCLLLKVRL